MSQTHNDVPNPNKRDGQQGPDMSDTAADQVELQPVENIKAPVKPALDKPTIPKKDAKIAQKAKDQLQEGNNSK